ncbi:serine hydrolase domain-containing protein [Paenibacillus turpanensis]|uniref:serine hydrolase domain-containing protein n=1 Tax=Paenibacillus turpanensis TaxID=2689078 RepID=UPI001408AE8E|nr:serine hydrolase [Paenibacillus turpanensis]
MSGTFWPTKQWRIGAPEEHGIDREAIRALSAHIGEKLPKLYSVLVIRHGVLVHEQYYNGTNENSLMNVRSVTKSFTSTLIGAAIGDGYVESVDVPAAAFFASDELPKDLGEQKLATTLRHLLTMSSGFFWLTGSKLGEKHLSRFHESKDWLRFIWRLPVVEDMRGRFQYRSTDSHLLSCVLTRATGRCAGDYAAERLFAPLGIRDVIWPPDPQGNTAGHVFLQLRARDMAKLGLLYLHRGEWDGRQLVPREYIDAAASAQIEGHPSYGEYGFKWWVSRFAGQPYYFAQGHGGQYIFVVPGLELVCVFTADPAVSRWKSVRPAFENILIKGTVPDR